MMMMMSFFLQCGILVDVGTAGLR